MTEMEELRIIPVFKSLVRPQLLAGGDRALVIILLLVSALLMGPGGLGAANLINFGIGIIVLLFGMSILRKMAKFDPYAFPIFKRAMRYKETYSASSGFRFKSK